MRTIALHLVLLLSICIADAREIESTWIFVPGESMITEDPWRIVIYDDSSVVSQTYFFGCKREFGTDLKLQGGVIEITMANGKIISIRKEEDRLVFRRELPAEAYDCVFVENEEWNNRFENAPSPPKNREEALAVLDQILPQEDKDHLKGMKKEDLAILHHGFGTGLRNGFGLWHGDSQIVKDYGGGHPDNVSMKLIEDYWATLHAKQNVGDDADQTATAPDSRPEGDEQPEPESKARPQ